MNQGNRRWEEVSDQVYYGSGFGRNFLVVDKENNIVLVTRWLEPSKIGEMVKLVLDSVQQ